MELKRQIGLPGAVLIIIADVIGTGIFLITGSLLGITGSAPAVLALWLLGGLTAVAGSMCYAELAAMWPDNGGEYVYLRKIYGKLPAFLAGWISLTVGFSASVAATALTLVWYLEKFFGGGCLSSPLAQKTAASLITVFFGAAHIVGVRRGSFVQNFFTFLKLLIVFSVIVFGFVYTDWSNFDRLTCVSSAVHDPAAYGLGLIIVMFAYSGWNGAVYIAGEIRNPVRNLPRALLIGSVSVLVLYFLINAVYLMSAQPDVLCSSPAVASVAAENLFGPDIAGILTLGIALVLLSSVSVQMMIGPRVYQAMAKDGMIFSVLSGTSSRFGTPVPAIILQMIIAVIYVFAGRDNMDLLITYMGFSLNIFPLMAAAGLIIMRKRFPDMNRPCKVPLYPLLPVFFIVMSVSMMTASLILWTKTSLFAVGVLTAGVVIYYIWAGMKK